MQLVHVCKCLEQDSRLQVRGVGEQGVQVLPRLSGGGQVRGGLHLQERKEELRRSAHVDSLTSAPLFATINKCKINVYLFNASMLKSACYVVVAIVVSISSEQSRTFQFQLNGSSGFCLIKLKERYVKAKCTIILTSNKVCLEFNSHNHALKCPHSSNSSNNTFPFPPAFSNWPSALDEVIDGGLVQLQILVSVSAQELLNLVLLASSSRSSGRRGRRSQ